jgi:hypothetical protein
MGSIAMTALIGRVPVDGTVNDPYPFKVLVGRTTSPPTASICRTWSARS